jgi:hypothetical protein
MRFEQWAKNPSCEANMIAAVRNVRMADVATAEGVAPSFGQSPFAIARGDQFERSLFYRDAEVLLEALIEKEVLPLGASGLVDFRLRMNGGTRISSLDAALEETREFLMHLATGSQAPPVPAVAAGAAIKIPKGVMLPEAVLIIDVLAVRTDGARPELIVGEVKTYPDRGGHTDPAELAGARAQAGIYVHALNVVAHELKIAKNVAVRDDGFLVLTRPGSNRPSVRAREELRYQAERARRGFELLEAAAQAAPQGLWAATAGRPPEELIAAIRSADTAYSEGCLSFCDRAPGCHQRALDAGDPVVLGEDVSRFVGRIDLHRVSELMGGDVPADEAEQDLVRRIRASDWTAA